MQSEHPISKAQVQYELPDRMWKFIEHALADLEAVERNPMYVVDMFLWHAPSNGKCYVCLAGAVMANTYQVSPGLDMSPSQMEGCTKHEKDALFALDCIRQGEIADAIDEYYGCDYPGGLDVAQEFFSTSKWAFAPRYESEPGMFKEYMRDVIAFLKSEDV